MTSVPVVILAGGLATRMGGLDKCLLSLDDNTTLLDVIIKRLLPQCASMAINANRDKSRFDAFHLPVIADSIPDFPGPLGGILAALDWAAEQNFQWVVTVAGDTPFFPANLVEKFTHAVTAQKAIMAYAESGGEDGDRRPHPTFGIWPTDLRDDLRATLLSGQRKVRSWAQHHKAIVVTFPFSVPDPFMNINTPVDLQIARAVFQELYLP